MRQGFDRGVIAGIVLLAAMMVGIAGTSYVNTRALRAGADRAVRSYEVLDAIAAVRSDTRKLQADQRAYIATGFEDWIKPYDESAGALRGTAAQLVILTTNDPEQHPRAREAEQEIETGIAGLNAVVKIRGEPNGQARVTAMAKERGRRSFVDPLLETLAEMDAAERRRLAVREAETRAAYDRAVFYGTVGAVLGLVALGLFVGVLRRSVRTRARGAARLAEQRKLLDATLASIGDAVIATDATGSVTFLNSVASELTGWTQADARGRSLDHVFHIVNETTRKPVENPAFRALKDGAVVGLANHTVLIARDGTERPIEDSAAPIRDEAGTPLGAVLVFRDVSARKRAEDALARVTAESARRKRLYETVLSATPDFVYVFSLDHRVMYANDALVAMWGRGTEGAIGKTFLEIGYEPWHAAMHDREIDEVRATKAPVRGEVPFAGTNGRRIYDYIFVPVLGADGEVEAVAGTTRDVTERKAMEDALRAADRKKDDFLALLAHELRNPLAPIRNGLQIVRVATDPRVRERYQEMMDRQLGHLVRLVDDLLDVSRINRNKMELRRARITLADVVNSAVETARPVIEAAKHELVVALPAEPVELDADLTRLAQVLSNLLTNSAKYTGAGGTITLAAQRDGTEIVVTVRDNGIGIPPESLVSIFDMFSQVDRAIERATGGLGIGLALVKGLVEMHGGTVSAASAGEGKGSEFTVRLPALPARAEIPAAPVVANGVPRGPKLRILVVDDNRDSAESMGEMLSLLGNEVALAHDGIEAVEQAGAFRPEIILMDVGMPRLNGLDATRRIREQPWGRDIRVIALTGWGQDADRETSKAAGCVGHLVKPVAPDELLRVLGEFAARS